MGGVFTGLGVSRCRFFIFGTGDKAGWCWHEFTDRASCPEGFEEDQYDFYELKAGARVELPTRACGGAVGPFLFGAATACACACVLLYLARRRPTLRCGTCNRLVGSPAAILQILAGRPVLLTGMSSRGRRSGTLHWSEVISIRATGYTAESKIKKQPATADASVSRSP